jgi:AraC-like DNA-binding protein
MGPALVDGDFAAHGHDFVELVVITGGMATHVINGKRHEIEAGDVMVLNRGAVHAFEDAQALKLTNVMYDPELIATVGDDVRGLPGFQALFVISPHKGGEFRCTMRLAPHRLVRVEHLLSAMADEHRGQTDGWKTQITALLLETVVLLSRSHGTTGTDTRGPDTALRLAETVGYMGAHLGEQITVDELAERAHLSRRHFIRLFGTLYGAPPLRYLSSLRIRHAANMLRSTAVPVSHIAHACGFPDSNYFTRVFTRLNGVSPRKYRTSGLSREFSP